MFFQKESWANEPNSDGQPTCDGLHLTASLLLVPLLSISRQLRLKRLTILRCEVVGELVFPIPPTQESLNLLELLQSVS